MDLEGFSVGELLALHRRSLAELRDRGVIRTGNAPVGDYAESLVKQAVNGRFPSNSQASWDVEDADGNHLQVKSRVISRPHVRGERQLSTFRSWEFTAVIVVLFNDALEVWRAARLDTETIQAAAQVDQHVNGFRVFATDELLDGGADWTTELSAAAADLDIAVAPESFPAITIIWPADTPDSPVRDSAGSWEALEGRLRASPWNPSELSAFRAEMSRRAKLWSGEAISTSGSSEEFLTKLADAGCCKIITA